VVAKGAKAEGKANERGGRWWQMAQGKSM